MYFDSIVYIVDDNEGVRHSLTLLVESTGLAALACESAQDFLDHFDPARPGCLLLDIRMPQMSGLELQARLVEDGVQLPVIIITGHADVLLAVRAMKAGAHDFFEKPFNDQLLLDSIASAIELNVEVFLEQREISDFLARVEKLSTREREVMVLLVQGKVTKEVAATLGISSKTVDAHRGNILGKTQMRSVHQLIMKTLKCKIDSVST